MLFFSDPTLLVSFVSITLLEIILGVDNVVFVALLASHLPEHQQARARTIGLMFALGMRIILLFAIAWIMSLSTPFMTVFGVSLSGQALLLLAGGLFLIYKATDHIHDEITHDHQEAMKSYAGGFTATIAQIVLLDMVFSFDSVMTAVGLTPHLSVIVAAMSVAMGVMLFSAGHITRFIKRFPTLKMLALNFLLLIGVFLCAEGLGLHVPKGYIYFAMGFALLVETLNLLSGRRRKR